MCGRHAIFLKSAFQCTEPYSKYLSSLTVTTAAVLKFSLISRKFSEFWENITLHKFIMLLEVVNIFHTKWTQSFHIISPRKISYSWQPFPPQKKILLLFSSSEQIYLHEFSLCGTCICVYVCVRERKIEFLPLRWDHEG